MMQKIDDGQGWPLTVTGNGAFGFRAVVDDEPSISGTGRTEDAAIAAARARLREHLAGEGIADTARSGRARRPTATTTALPRPTTPTLPSAPSGPTAAAPPRAATSANSSTPARPPTGGRAPAPRRPSGSRSSARPGGPPPAAPPAAPPFRLLDLLAAADAKDDPAAAARRERERFEADFADVRDGALGVLKDILTLDGFETPLAYEVRRETTDDAIEAELHATTRGGDLQAGIGVFIRLGRTDQTLSVNTLRVGLQRKSTGRSVETDAPVRDLDGVPAIDRDDVHAALEKLVAQVAHGAEPPTEPESQPSPLWQAIYDLEDRVDVLEERAGIRRAGDAANTDGIL